MVISVEVTNGKKSVLSKEQVKKYKKEYKFCKIRKSMCKKSDFIQRLAYLQEKTDSDNLHNKILEAIDNKGKVFGIRKDKQFVAIWIFSYDAAYFERVDLNAEVKAEEKADYEKTAKMIFSDRKAALVLTDFIILDEVSFVEDVYHDLLLTYVKDSLELEDIGGVEYKDELYYRRYLKIKHGKFESVLLILSVVGMYVSGFLFGRLLFDDIIFGFLYGFLAVFVWFPVFHSIKKSEIVKVKSKEGDGNAVI